MPKLNKTKQFFLRGYDSGAIAVTFALLMGSGALLLIIALVVDGGLVYAIRDRVQNRSESVAAALTQHCAKGNLNENCFNNNFTFASQDLVSAPTEIPLTDALDVLANPANDGVTFVTNTCGMSTLWPQMPTCAPLSGGDRDCETDLSTMGFTNWVRVYASSDPSGFSPLLANFPFDQTTKYIEYACSQFYWGQGSSVPHTTAIASSQIPFAIGICDALAASSGGVVQIVGDSASTSPCGTFRDRQNRQYSGGIGAYPGASPTAPKTNGTANGFIAWRTTTNSQCWTIGSKCPQVTLASERSATSNYPLGSSYSVLVQTVLKNGLGKTFLMPVVDKNAAGEYVVKSYVGFTFLGYRATTTATLGSSVAQATYEYQKSSGSQPAKNVVISWGTSCPLPTSTSATCLAGIISPRVYSPYDPFTGISLTTDAGVPDFGYYIQRQAP